MDSADEHPKVNGFDGSALCGACLDEPWPCAALRGAPLSRQGVDRLIADMEDDLFPVPPLSAEVVAVADRIGAQTRATAPSPDSEPLT